MYCQLYLINRNTHVLSVLPDIQGYSCTVSCTWYTGLHTNDETSYRRLSRNFLDFLDYDYSLQMQKLASFWCAKSVSVAILIIFEEKDKNQPFDSYISRVLGR